jgi:hypothetical protein
MTLNQDIILTIINHHAWKTQREILNKLIKDTHLVDIIDLKTHILSKENFAHLIEKKVFYTFDNDILEKSLCVLKDNDTLFDFHYLINHLAQKQYNNKVNIQTYRIINEVYFNSSNFNELIYTLIQDEKWQEKEPIFSLIHQHMSLFDVFSLNNYFKEKINNEHTTHYANALINYFMEQRTSEIHNNMELKVFLKTIFEKGYCELIEKHHLMLEIGRKNWCNQNTFDILNDYYCFDNNDKLYYIYAKFQPLHQKSNQHVDLHLILNELKHFNISILEKNETHEDTDTFFKFLLTSLLQSNTTQFLESLTQLAQHFSAPVLFSLPSFERTMSLKMVGVLDDIEKRWKMLQSNPNDTLNNEILMEQMEVYQKFNHAIKNIDPERMFNYSYFEAQHKYIQHGLKKTLDRLMGEYKNSSQFQSLYYTYQATFEKTLFQYLIEEPKHTTEKKKVKI